MEFNSERIHTEKINKTNPEAILRATKHQIKSVEESLNIQKERLEGVENPGQQMSIKGQIRALEQKLQKLEDDEREAERKISGNA